MVENWIEACWPWLAFPWNPGGTKICTTDYYNMKISSLFLCWMSFSYLENNPMHFETSFKLWNKLAKMPSITMRINISIFHAYTLIVLLTWLILNKDNIFNLRRIGTISSSPLVVDDACASSLASESFVVLSSEVVITGGRLKYAITNLLV